MDSSRRRGSTIPDSLRIEKRRGSLPPVSFDPTKKNSLALPTGLASIGERRGTLFSTFVEGEESAKPPEGERTLESLYEGLTDDDDKAQVRSIIRGKTRADELPAPRPTTVELYLCNPSKDMAEEMNQLSRRAFPAIRKHCRDKYGLDFHAIDLDRESRDDNVIDDHSHFRVTADQINYAQNISMGPYFVAFLGDKYGDVELPETFTKADFEAIRKAVQDLGCDVTPLDQWYFKDENDESEQYQLKPISSNLGCGYSRSEWELDRAEVQALLGRGLEKCVRVNSVSEGLTQKVQASVAERQIEEGLFHVLRPADRNNNCICFMRTLSDIDKQLNSALADNFTDLAIQEDGSCKRNEEKQKALQVLKQKIKAALPSANVLEESLRWRQPVGVDTKFHRMYFDKLVKEFTEKVKQLLDANMAKQQLQHPQPDDPIYLEVLQNWVLAKHAAKHMQGRSKLLMKVSQYCTSVTENEPLVLHGAPGCGRTTLIANAATKLATSGQGLAVLRFCGHTSTNTNINHLLRSICTHICHLTSLPLATLPDSDADIKRFFADLMERGIPKGSSLGKNEAFKGRIVVFLDSIELLTGQNIARLDWLPGKLAQNIKVVVTTLTQTKITEAAKVKFDNEQVVEVPELEINDGCLIVKENLRWQGRQLTDEQRKSIREIVTKCPSPMFCKLLFHDCIKWKFDMEVSSEDYPHTLEGFINIFLVKLEQVCNPVIVARALSLLTLSQFGLSSLELDDVLSLDDVTMKQVFKKGDPAVKRIKFLEVARIKYEMSEFLMDKQVDNTSVMTWKHKEFGNAVRLRYVKDEQMERELHRLMADFFLGTYAADKLKPNTPPRYVPDQPLVFKDTSNNEAKEFYNLRKLCQLPYHLAHAQMYPLLQNEVFFNFTWLKTKLKALSVQHIIQDCDLVEDEEVKLLREALMLGEETITRDPDKLCLELTGRLLPHAIEYQVIQDLITECDNDAPETCPIIPIMQTYLTPGCPLENMIQPRTSTKGKIDVALLEHNNTLLVAMKPINMAGVQLRDIFSGERMTDIQCEPGTNIYPSRDGKFMCLVREMDISTYRVDNGQLQSQMRLDHGHITDISVSNTRAAILFKEEKGPLVVDIVNGKELKRLDYKGSSLLLTSSNDDYLVTNMGRVVVVLDLQKVEQRLVHQVKELPHSLLFSTKPDCLFMMYTEREILKVKLDIAKRDANTSGMLEDENILDMSLSHGNDRLLVTTTMLLHVMDVKTEALKATIHDMPKGFVQTMTHFRQAAFTSGDAMIVALRYMHVAFWSATSYQPLKVVQAAVHPPLRLMTTATINRLVLLQHDYTVQIWNPEKIESKVEPLHLNANGAILAMATATSGNRLICYGHAQPGKGEILDINKGVPETTLDIKDQLPEEAKVKDVSFSPKGKYLLTSIRDPAALSAGTTDMLHAVSTAKQVTSVADSIFTRIAVNDDLVVSVCQRRDTYTIVGNFLNEKKDNMTHETYLPEGVLDGTPALTENGEFLLFVYELKPQRDRVFHQRFPNQGRKLMLCTTLELLRTMSNKGKGLQELDYSSWKYMTDDEYLLAVYPLKADFILLLFADGVGKPEVKGDKEAFKKQQKLAVVYSVKTKRVTKFFKNFMQYDSDIDRLVLSSQGTYILDQMGRIYSSADNKLLSKMPLRGIDHRTTQLLFDGKFVITMTLDHRRVVIFSSDKKEIKVSIPIHGVAEFFQIAKDGEILVIACDDGRILLFRTLLDYRSVQGPASGLVSTHKFPPAMKQRPFMPEEKDELIDSVSMLDPREDRNLKTADATTKPTSIDSARKPSLGASRWGQVRVQHAAGTFTGRKPSLKTLAKAINITHRAPNNKSRACVIQ